MPFPFVVRLEVRCDIFGRGRPEGCPAGRGQTSTATRTVVVDNTKPAIAISKAPANGAKLTGSAAVTAAASDRNGIARVELLVNGKPVATDTRAGYAFTLNPARYGKTFTVQLRAYDRAGNIQYSSRRTYHR